MQRTKNARRVEIAGPRLLARLSRGAKMPQKTRPLPRREQDERVQEARLLQFFVQACGAPKCFSGRPTSDAAVFAVHGFCKT